MKKITLGIAALFAAFTMNAQSDCANAQAITVAPDASQTITVSTINGTTSSDPCITAGNTVGQHGVWYSYTPSQNMKISVIVEAPTSATSYFPTLSILTGNCGNTRCYTGDYFGSNNDENNPNTAQVEFPAFANTTYYIYMDDLFMQVGNGGLGPFDFTISTDSNVAAAPDAVVNPSPADGATDTPYTLYEDEDGNIVTSADFSWDAATTGTAPVGYRLEMAEDAAFTDNAISGTFQNSTVDGLYLPKTAYFEANTTYYWRVAGVNSDGFYDFSTSAVWSFTTASEPILSTNDIEANNSLTHYTSNGQLNINSEQQLDQVTIYSILGNRVASQELNNTNATIEISNLQAGLYIAQVQVEGKTKTFKFVKK